VVVGQGDRSYEKFCEMGHQYHKHLERLGGRPLLPAGEVGTRTVLRWWY
jgi:sulfite reductase alpha subunit-like flavoprotein